MAEFIAPCSIRQDCIRNELVVFRADKFQFRFLGNRWELKPSFVFFFFFCFREAEANFQFIDILDRSINFIVRRRCMNHALHESMNE